jgi:hypothetical protein
VLCCCVVLCDGDMLVGDEAMMMFVGHVIQQEWPSDCLQGKNRQKKACNRQKASNLSLER